MGVWIDEPRRDDEARRVDRSRCRDVARRGVADEGDAVAANADVARSLRPAAAVDDRSAADEDVDLLLRKNWRRAENGGERGVEEAD